LIARDYRYSHFRKGEEYEAELGRGAMDRYMADREAEILVDLVPRLFPNGLDRYLDFACGTGRITRLIEGMAAQSYGIDVAPGMLDVARRQCPKTTFLECDLTQQDPGLEPVRLVTAFRFFGNAQEELRRSALRAIHRLLVDGGYLVFNNHRNPVSLRNLLLRIARRPLPDYHGRTVDLHYWKLQSLLKETGFELMRSRGIGVWIFRTALERMEVLNSRTAHLLEPISHLRPLGPFCPDAVLIARRLPAREPDLLAASVDERPAAPPAAFWKRPVRDQ
jgi:SAM-dependent methyltransferase